MKGICNNKGFSLIEIVTVIIVLGILGGFTFSFFNHSATIYLTGSKQTKLFQEATYVMERLTQELKDAKYVYRYAANDFWLQMANYSDQMGNGEYVRYYKDGENIYRSVWTGWWWGTPRLVCQKVDQFTVSQSTAACDSSYPNCMITVDLVLEDTTVKIGNPPTNISVSINTSVSPKNFESGWGGRSYNGYYYDIVE